MGAIPTNKNDERRSREPQKMGAQMEVAQQWKCVGYDGHVLAGKGRLDVCEKRSKNGA